MWVVYYCFNMIQPHCLNWICALIINQPFCDAPIYGNSQIIRDHKDVIHSKGSEQNNHQLVFRDRQAVVGDFHGIGVRYSTYASTGNTLGSLHKRLETHSAA